MCKFKETHYGELLDSSISDFLSEYTDMSDVQKAAKHTNISFTTLKQVRNRSIAMSENSSKGVIRLMEIAVENCGNAVIKARIAKGIFSKLLKI